MPDYKEMTVLEFEQRLGELEKVIAHRLKNPLRPDDEYTLALAEAVSMLAYFARAQSEAKRETYRG
jgi:hypothetical protein